MDIYVFVSLRQGFISPGWPQTAWLFVLVLFCGQFYVAQSGLKSSYIGKDASWSERTLGHPGLELEIVVSCM